MKFEKLSPGLLPDRSQRVEDSDNDMKQFQRAEKLAYDTVWLAEHLFPTYGSSRRRRSWPPPVIPTNASTNCKR
jgi:alkanesulfonate monooxygenase SsuD/methylene tetrahydromethanopterin reductase-like flavin-dependent oxidoreductase (luciferase family)